MTQTLSFELLSASIFDPQDFQPILFVLNDGTLKCGSFFSGRYISPNGKYQRSEVRGFAELPKKVENAG